MKKISFLVVISFLFVLTSNAQDRNIKNTFAQGNSRETIVVNTLETQTIDDIVQNILGAGISYSNVVYTGDSTAIGDFSGGNAPGIGIDNGIVLSTGLAMNALGPNELSGTSFSHSLPGDLDLDAISGGTTYDACVLEFDFIPTTSLVYVEFILGSDEYMEYTNIADIFAFFINGENCALIPGTETPVSIGTVNLDTNAQYYIDNPDTNAVYDIEFDGFTTVLTAVVNCSLGETNHIKLAVADYSDTSIDTWILIKGNSFNSIENPLSISAIATSASNIDLSWSLNANSEDVIVVYSDAGFGVPVNGAEYNVDDIIPGGGTVIYKGSATAFSHSGLTANTLYNYKIWSNNSNSYSSGIETNATTMIGSGINDINAINIALYPNPSTGLFTIQNADGFDVIISDINGKTIQDFSVNNSDYSVNISDQASGLYFIKFTNDTQTTTLKFVKQ